MTRWFAPLRREYDARVLRGKHFPSLVSTPRREADPGGTRSGGPMRPCPSRLLIVLTVLLALPASGWAQDAALSGTVSDSTGGVLPGVTVTALHEASGNTFVSVTDERGAYRIPVRTGT